MKDFMDDDAMMDTARPQREHLHSPPRPYRGKEVQKDFRRDGWGKPGIEGFYPLVFFLAPTEPL
jgi:hypothetical protein